MKESSEHLRNTAKCWDYIWTGRTGPLVVQVKMMADLKRLLDPRGILNPYKVLPEAVFKRASQV
jgi:FAD/FMN-containing dehydrogenase